jgi:hypothetical protein
MVEPLSVDVVSVQRSEAEADLMTTSAVMRLVYMRKTPSPRAMSLSVAGPSGPDELSRAGSSRRPSASHVKMAYMSTQASDG